MAAFDAAYAGVLTTGWGGAPVKVVGMPDLIALKKKAGRPQDLADIAMLEGRKNKK